MTGFKILESEGKLVLTWSMKLAKENFFPELFLTALALVTFSAFFPVFCLFSSSEAEEAAAEAEDASSFAEEDVAEVAVADVPRQEHLCPAASSLPQ